MDGIAIMNDKAGRFRDFFDLQLRFAEAVAERTAMPLAEAVLRYTNFHRRFGLGDVTADEPHPSWHDYARELSRFTSHDARAGWTQAFYAQSPDERLSFPDHVFGCFYFQTQTLLVPFDGLGFEHKNALFQLAHQGGGIAFKQL